MTMSNLTAGLNEGSLGGTDGATDLWCRFAVASLSQGSTEPSTLSHLPGATLASGRGVRDNTAGFGVTLLQTPPGHRS